VVADKAGVLSEVSGEKSRLSNAGQAVMEQMLALPERYHAVLDTFVIMPNHVHAIIGLKAAPAAGGNVSAPDFAALVREFKAATTKRLREMGLEGFAWQRQHYPHRIWNDEELERLRKHLRTNPEMWAYDENNPERVR